METLVKANRSSLGNALNLLNQFNMDKLEFTLSELAEKLNVGHSTVYRLTMTLMQEGFLARDPITRKFRLGGSILAIEQTILSYYDICRFSLPVLEKLVKETGETSHLSILKNNKIIYLQKVESPNDVYMYSYEGKKNPIHATSSGKSILAYRSQSDIHKVIGTGLDSYTKNTITDPIQFINDLNKIKKLGYAYSKDELREGISSLAAPVLLSTEEVNYSISIAGPTSRINPYREKELSKAIIDAAKKLKELVIEGRQ